MTDRPALSPVEPEPPHFKHSQGYDLGGDETSPVKAAQVCGAVLISCSRERGHAGMHENAAGSEWYGDNRPASATDGLGPSPEVCSECAAAEGRVRQLETALQELMDADVALYNSRTADNETRMLHAWGDAHVLLRVLEGVVTDQPSKGSSDTARGRGSAGGS